MSINIFEQTHSYFFLFITFFSEARSLRTKIHGSQDEEPLHSEGKINCNVANFIM